jgi:predicted small secreted protein
MKTSVAACAAVALLLAAACAADTMRGYVGQDIRAVVLAYGPPANEIDLGGGARAFQWSKTSVDATPPTEVTTTERDRKGRRVTRTEFVGGTQTVTDCVYTFLAARDPGREGWIVTGFRQPSLDCAIGGLNW